MTRTIAPKFRDPEYYLYRAEEVRTIGLVFKNRFAKETMLTLAEDYETMALIIRANLALGHYPAPEATPPEKDAPLNPPPAGPLFDGETYERQQSIPSGSGSILPDDGPGQYDGAERASDGSGGDNRE